MTFQIRQDALVLLFLFGCLQRLVNQRCTTYCSTVLSLCASNAFFHQRCTPTRLPQANKMLLASNALSESNLD
jgi:hypothetical protein